jgi:phosphoenolpyruvate phosphomutase
MTGDLRSVVAPADTGTAERRTKAARLRALLADGHVVRAVGAHDGLGAKLVDRAGFEAVWASGFELSASHGLPDASLLTMTQYLDAAEVMDAAVGIPIIADCDTGFGGPLNVAHLMRSYERRGIAAICIEDKMFPKVNSFAAVEHPLISTEDFASKIRSAKLAQQNPDTVLIARTEALISGQGVDEALARARSYAAAGADAILVHSKRRTAAQVLEFGARWDLDLPLVAVPTTYGDVHESDLLDAGFRIVIYANHGLRAAISSMTTTLVELAKTGRGRAVEDRIASMPEVFELQGMHLPFSATS